MNMHVNVGGGAIMCMIGMGMGFPKMKMGMKPALQGIQGMFGNGPQTNDNQAQPRQQQEQVDPPHGPPSTQP